MNKKMIPVFLVFIVAMVLISAWPYVLESRMPVNQFISKEKKSGMIPIVQFITEENQAAIAAASAASFNEKSPTKVVVKSFDISENKESAAKLEMDKLGFVVYDADGNVAARYTGVVSVEILSKIMADVHTH